MLIFCYATVREHVRSQFTLYLHSLPLHAFACGTFILLLSSIACDVLLSVFKVPISASEACLSFYCTALGPLPASRLKDALEKCGCGLCGLVGALPCGKSTLNSSPSSSVALQRDCGSAPATSVGAQAVVGNLRSTVRLYKTENRKRCTITNKFTNSSAKRRAPRQISPPLSSATFTSPLFPTHPRNRSQ